MATPLDPQHRYVFLAADGEGTAMEGGDAFWSLPDAELDRFGRGWLVAEFTFGADWPHWEMHPEGDEYVYLLSGRLDLVLRRQHGDELLAMQPGRAFLVPRGVWHTARVHEASRMLHITMGAGTQHDEDPPR